MLPCSFDQQKKSFSRHATVHCCSQLRIVSAQKIPWKAENLKKKEKHDAWLMSKWLGKKMAVEYTLRTWNIYAFYTQKQTLRICLSSVWIANSWVINWPLYGPKFHCQIFGKQIRHKWSQTFMTKLKRNPSSTQGMYQKSLGVLFKFFPINQTTLFIFASS